MRNLTSIQLEANLSNAFENVFKNCSDVDLIMISETKVDNSFLKGQFLIKGFCELFRIDRNIHVGEILFNLRQDIPVKLLSVETLPAACNFVEINFRKRKWLVCCPYNPHKDNKSNHYQLIRKPLDLYSSNYESIILVGVLTLR